MILDELKANTPNCEDMECCMVIVTLYPFIQSHYFSSISLASADLFSGRLEGWSNYSRNSSSICAGITHHSIQAPFLIHLRSITQPHSISGVMRSIAKMVGPNILSITTLCVPISIVLVSRSSFSIMFVCRRVLTFATFRRLTPAAKILPYCHPTEQPPENYAV